MDYKKLEDLHLPKKEITKTTKKIKQMGLVIEVNIFLNVSEWLSVTDVWWLVCVSNIQVCTMFIFLLFFVAYQDVWNIRGHFMSFCLNGYFVFSCSERVFPFSKQGLDFVCFWASVWLRERERERPIAQHILSLTSSSSPDRENRNAYICKC